MSCLSVYVMKRTNIVLDEKLVCEGLKTTGLKTQRALIDFALKELVRREKQSDLLKLKGQVHWTGDLSAMRKTRTA
jgi:Arc/MetJ family transcription regulator